MKQPLAIGTALVAAVLVTAGAGATAKPALRLLGKQPLAVRGASFKPSERVRVSFSTSTAKGVRSVRSSRAGVFTAQAPATVAYDPCVESLVVRAIGAGGDAARLKLPQRACPPALRDPAP
jgi:hypothetical protein